MKHAQQSFIREKDKNRVVEKIAEPLRDKSCTQVVVFKAEAGRIILRQKSRKEIISDFR